MSSIIVIIFIAGGIEVGGGGGESSTGGMAVSTEPGKRQFDGPCKPDGFKKQELGP